MAPPPLILGSFQKRRPKEAIFLFVAFEPQLQLCERNEALFGPCKAASGARCRMV
jgi:hypothetical protein